MKEKLLNKKLLLEKQLREVEGQLKNSENSILLNVIEENKKKLKLVFDVLKLLSDGFSFDLKISPNLTLNIGCFSEKLIEDADSIDIFRDPSWRIESTNVTRSFRKHLSIIESIAEMSIERGEFTEIADEFKECQKHLDKLQNLSTKAYLLLCELIKSISPKNTKKQKELEYDLFDALIKYAQNKQLI